jgi:hypothetical protein
MKVVRLERLDARADWSAAAGGGRRHQEQQQQQGQ